MSACPVDGELPEQGELGRGQVHRLPVEPDLLQGQVDDDVADRDDRGCLIGGHGRAGPAQRRGDPGQQLLDAERLGHVVIRPHVQGGHLVPLAAAGRDHDDGRRERSRISHGAAQGRRPRAASGREQDDVRGSFVLRRLQRAHAIHADDGVEDRARPGWTGSGRRCSDRPPPPGRRSCACPLSSSPSSVPSVRGRRPRRPRPRRAGRIRRKTGALGQRDQLDPAAVGPARIPPGDGRAGAGAGALAVVSVLPLLPLP